MPFPRSSGILLHPTSFPSRYGIGDLGSDAYRFIDFLAESSQQLWQILPVGPTGYGNSPYMSYSAMAGNHLLISPEQLGNYGLLTGADLANLPEFPATRVDFEVVIATKMNLFWQAFDRFQHQPNHEFEQFCQNSQDWLDDYALFMAIKKVNQGKAWNAWDTLIAKRQPEAIATCQESLKTEVMFYKYLQFEFFRQWSPLKQYANQRGIQIIGDIPIYVAHDSADVWSNPEIFCLDVKTGEPAGMAGVPPDYFSSTGQLWGNPVYLWRELAKQDFAWWVKRFQGLLNYVDIIRIDHFRGFEAFWQVKQGETTAIKGKWVKAPGDALFTVVNEKLGKLPIVAEDLGTISPEVEALRDKFEFPGMKILQFAFGSGAGNPYLPFNYDSRNCLVYTGTHDNDTTIGWFNQLGEGDKAGLLAYLGSISTDGVHWDLIRLALSSVGNQAIIPLQDLLGLDTHGRMNMPGKSDEGNWSWRYQAEDLTPQIRDRLKGMTETYGRAHHH